MIITKFYIIKTGYDKPDGISWYEEIEYSEYVNENVKDYKWIEFLPTQYPIYTSFEESEKAVLGDWQGELYEYHDTHAKILEYSSDSNCGGHYQLTHEWHYKHDGKNYQKISEKVFPYEQW